MLKEYSHEQLAVVATSPLSMQKQRNAAFRSIEGSRIELELNIHTVGRNTGTIDKEMAKKFYRSC